MPVAKVWAGGAAGAAALVIVYAVGLFGIDVPAEVASALTFLLGTGAAYIKS